MRKFLKHFLSGAAILMLLFSMASCAKSYDSAGDAGYPENGNSFVGGTTDKGDGTIVENVEKDRKIIKNVNESVQTDKYDSFLSELNEAVKNANGYISSANYSGENYFSENNLRNANLTIRIPAESLSTFTEKIDSISVVTYYNESIHDVTTAYVDVESRIKVLEAEETALLEILKSSTTTSDALAVRTRLVDVQADLASLRAQKNSLDDRIEYSTVYLNISEVRRAVEHNPGFFAEVGGKFADSLDGIGQGLRNFAVWFLGNILYILFAAALCFGIGVLVRFVLKKRNPRKNRKTDTASSEDSE